MNFNPQLQNAGAAPTASYFNHDRTYQAPGIRNAEAPSNTEQRQQYPADRGFSDIDFDLNNIDPALRDTQDSSNDDAALDVSALDDIQGLSSPQQNFSAPEPQSAPTTTAAHDIQATSFPQQNISAPELQSAPTINATHDTQATSFPQPTSVVSELQNASGSNAARQHSTFLDLPTSSFPSLSSWQQ